MNFELKGFQNPIGHNNCFLNVGLQSLWHLVPFHLQFVAHKTHFHDPECCLFCSLKLIFDQYKYGDSNTLPPTVIRNDLSFLFAKDSKFQIGQLDDAAEALESLLDTLHNQLTQGPRATKDTPETTCEPPCLVHQVFGIGVVQQACCSHCAATSEPFVSNAVIDYIPVAALRASAHESSLSPRPSTFSELLRRARSGHDQRKCTNDECGKQAPLLQYLITRPAVYSVGLVWESDETPMSDIIATLELIGLDLDTRGLYHQSEGEHCLYKLKGMVCYYGKHYIAYFYSVSRGCWIGFDDVIVSEVGPYWSNVLSKCMRGKDQPSLLFYEKVDYSSPYSESPVSTPTSTPIGVVEDGIGNGANAYTNGINTTYSNGTNATHPNGTNTTYANGSNTIYGNTIANGTVSRQVYGAEGGVTHTAGGNSSNGDLINFSSASQTRSSQPHTYVPLTTHYNYAPYASDLHNPITRNDDLSLGHRLTSKISQKLHHTPPVPNPAPQNYSHGLSSLAPSARAGPTLHTPSIYATPPPIHLAGYNSSAPSYSSNLNYATTNPSYTYSAANSSYLYSRPPTGTAPISTTPAYAPPTTSSSVTALRNGSPSRQRSDPFSSLLANSQQSNPSTTRLASSSQRPSDPSSYQSTPSRDTSSSYQRGASPAHQRPSPASSAYVPPSSRGVSPSHQRPTEYTSSATRGVSPSRQRPFDYYSKGLSASRTSAYPPPPTLNPTSMATPTRGTSPSHQRPSYDAHLYSSASPSRPAPEPPAYATQPTTLSSDTRGISRRPIDPSPPASYIPRNPSPSRSQVPPPSSLTTTHTLIPQPATTSSAAYMTQFVRPPAPSTSIYNYMDKSSFSPSNKYSPRDSLDKGVESYLQNMSLNNPHMNPIPVSAPPPRYTSPKRTYPSDANYHPSPSSSSSSSSSSATPSYGLRDVNGMHTITNATSSPSSSSSSSLLKGSPPPAGGRKSVTFLT